MPTVRDLITDAYRVGGIIGIEDEPSAGEAAFALTGLQSMLHSWITHGTFGSMTDVFSAVDYTAAENERVTVDDAIVTIPYTFEDDEGETRAPLQLAAITVVTATGSTSYIYDRRQWVAVEAIALTDECPLAQYGARGLACALAMELVALPTFGGTVTPSMMQAATSFRGAVMTARYSARTNRAPVYY